MSILFILVPLCSLIFLNLPFRKLMRVLAFPWLCTVALAQACVAVLQLCGQLAGIKGVFFCLDAGMADRAGSVVLLSAGLVAVASLMAGRALLHDEEKEFNYINLLLVSLAGLNGVALARDIFTLYVFIEIAAVASYILISLHKDREALQAAFKYIVLSAAASAMMLASVALLLLVIGDTSFAGLREGIAGSPHGAVVMFALALFVCGAFIKGGQVPFHGWLPDVYSSAPAPVSVFLAGAVTKTLGAFVLIRMAVSVVSFTGPLGQAAMFIGTLSIVAGACAALVQTDLKRLLAWSSVSQIGYIVLGVGSGSPLGLAGALLHLFNHSVFKSTLFLNAAAVESKTATRDMNSLGGMSARMPVTAVTSVVSWLSAAGIPPLAGFWSKLLIVVALWGTGHYVYASAAVVASVITLAYFLLMQRQVFQGNLRDELGGVTEAGIGLTLPASVLAAISIGLGLAFPLCMVLLKF